MTIKKKKLRKAFFYILLKCLKQERKKSKRGKVWVKDLFQERENKGTFQQTLHNIRVSDRETHFRHMITQI